MCGESNQEYANDMAQTRYEGPQILLRVIEIGYRSVLNHPKMVELVIAQCLRWPGVKCLQFAERIAAGAADRKNLEPSEGSSNNSNLPTEHTSLDSNFLSKTFAEMENWSDMLRKDAAVLEALRSASEGDDKTTSRSSLRRSQMRGPSR